MRNIPSVILIAVAGMVPVAAQAQISLNYDDLSSLEEPLAFEVGKATVLVTGVVDAPVTLAIDSAAFQDDVNVSVTGNFEVNAEMQLWNRWNVGFSYFGQYDENTNDYSDNVAGYVRTSWGSLIGGNVGGLVREQTRRRRGVGNAALAFDDYYGGLRRWGGAYSGRFGPVILSSVVDEDGDFQVGAEFQRPIGHRDFRVTGRAGTGTYLAADGTTSFDSNAVDVVGEIVFGSSLFDLGMGYERLQSGSIDVDRWFVSGGAQTKIGVLSLSAAGHYGQLDGTAERSASLGLAYDVARGLSTNLGVNARKAEVTRQGIRIVDEDETTATASVRYSF